MKAACSEADALESKFLPWNREQGKNPFAVGLFGVFFVLGLWGFFWVMGSGLIFFPLELLNRVLENTEVLSLLSINSLE